MGQFARFQLPTEVVRHLSESRHHRVATQWEDRYPPHSTDLEAESCYREAFLVFRDCYVASAKPSWDR